MKANLKGLSGIKGLALRHGEKILITIVGLLAVWFVISSFKLPRLEDQYQAAKLQSQINETNLAISGSTWPEEDSEEIRSFKPVEKKGIFTVDPEKYRIRGPAPIVAATLLRGDPVVLNAVDVRAIGSSGLLAFQDKDTLAEQERLRKLKEEQLEKKQERDQAKQLEEGTGPEGGRRAGRGGRDPEAEFNTEEFDPDHPDRRLIEGMGSPAGVPLQGGERLERVHWATIVAKVPVREQLKQFQDAFQNARGYDAMRDFPQYVGYQVQRAEVVPGKPLAWNFVYVFDGQKKYIPHTHAGKFVNIDTVTKLGERAATEWAAPPLEPVDARWTDMLLTLPLPPLVGRDFGADATHPDIPLAINAPPIEEEQELAPEAPTDKPAEGDDEFSAGTGAGAAGQPRSGGEFNMARPPMRSIGGPEFGGSRGFRGGGGPEGPEGPGYGGGLGRSSFAGGIASGQRTELPRGVDFLLLRFFDYTVEPGKEYKYRVKIVLNDPNAAIPTASGFLEPAVVDRRTKEMREAKAKARPAPFYRLAEEWSEPSGTVGIPIGIGTVHIAEAKLPSPKVRNDEPSIKVVAETFDIDPDDKSPIHVAHEKEFRRGAVVNIKEEMRFTGESDRWIDTKDDYELNTGLTLLDIQGADKLVKEVTSPTRVLMMDIAGQLSIRDELTDAPEVQYLRLVFTDDKGRNRSNQPGGEFGPEGPGGGGRPRGPR